MRPYFYVLVMIFLASVSSFSADREPHSEKFKARFIKRLPYRVEEIHLLAPAETRSVESIAGGSLYVFRANAAAEGEMVFIAGYHVTYGYFEVQDNEDGSFIFLFDNGEMLHFSSGGVFIAGTDLEFGTFLPLRNYEYRDVVYPTGRHYHPEDNTHLYVLQNEAEAFVTGFGRDIRGEFEIEMLAQGYARRYENGVLIFTLEHVAIAGYDDVGRHFDITRHEAYEEYAYEDGEVQRFYLGTGGAIFYESDDDGTEPSVEPELDLSVLQPAPVPLISMGGGSPL